MTIATPANPPLRIACVANSNVFVITVCMVNRYLSIQYNLLIIKTVIRGTTHGVKDTTEEKKTLPPVSGDRVQTAPVCV
jgi:hypothetical protein